MPCPMNTPSNDLEALLELDARHDELLQRLDELDKRIELVLAACVPAQKTEARVDSGPAETTV
jgi:uncharacterized protein YdcH (DUF465 family)